MRHILFVVATLIHLIVSTNARASNTEMLYAAKASSQAYNDAELGHRVESLTLVKLFKNPKGSFCNVFITTSNNQNTIVIAYRGSASIIDWKNNFKTIPISAVVGPGMDKHGKVHAGFMLSYMASSSDLLSYLKHFMSFWTIDKAIFTGHSQGGAVAMIAAYDFLLHYPEYQSRVELITFGQPRVGLFEFTNKFKKVVKHYTRVVSVSVKEFRDVKGNVIIKDADEDLVAHIPPALLGFRHAGEKVEVLCKSRRLTKCHDDATYQSAIENEYYLN